MATRVLWLTKGLGPGGAERLLVEVARHLDHDRFDVTAAFVLPWKDHLAGELEAAGVRTVCLSRRERDPMWPARLRALMAGFDVVHAHSPVVAAAARLAARAVRPRPEVVVTEHNTWGSHHLATRFANRLTWRLDDVRFAVTGETRDSMSRDAAAATEVLTHGIAVDEIRARGASMRAPMRAAFGIGDDAVVIGTVANLRAQKDYPNLLAAVRLLVDAGQDVRLLAVGQGPLSDEIRRERDRLRLERHVDLLGFRSDAVDVMAACDVFVLASAWEGWPVAVMEALALGLPVIATRVGGVAEQLDSSCAVLVPPARPAALADALAAVLTDPDERARLAAGAATAAQRYDVGSAVRRLESVYSRRARSADGHVAAAEEPATSSVQRSGGRAVPVPYELRPMVDDDRPAVLALLAASLGWEDDARSRELFAWKHVDNPFGPSPGWVGVTPDDGVVAVRLFMRWRFRRGRSTLDAVRAVDTATHPDHQGRGLFTALTLAAVEACCDDGAAWVFNTPNTQSRPGYLKMGWRDVGRLRAAVRPTTPRDLVSLVRSRVPAERWSLPIDIGTDVMAWLDTGGGSALAPPEVPSTDRFIRTDVDDEFLRWRFAGLPRLAYRVVTDDEATAIVRLRTRGSARELVVSGHAGPRRAIDALVVDAARDVGATHILRLGPPDLRHGFVPLPGGGPVLTWRALADQGPPPLPNWHLLLGDVELF